MGMNLNIDEEFHALKHRMAMAKKQTYMHVTSYSTNMVPLEYIYPLMIKHTSNTFLVLFQLILIKCGEQINRNLGSKETYTIWESRVDPIQQERHLLLFSKF